MTRFLLTLLALLSGLTASGASAEARIRAMSDAQIGACQSLSCEERSVPSTLLLVAPKALRDERSGADACGGNPGAIVRAKTVQIGIDRARE